MTLNDLEPSERKRLARSSGLGAAFWVLALLVLALVPVTRKPFPDPDYPPVHLSLTSPVTAAAPVKQIASAQEPVPQAETPAAPAAKTPSEPVKAAPKPATAKPAPAKTPTAPAAKSAAAKPAPAKTAPAPAASSGGLGIPDFDVPVTSSNTASGTSESLDFSSARQTQNPVQTSVPSGGTLRSELEGSAATAASGKSSGAAVSSKNASSTQTGSASSATADALKGVEGAASTGLSSRSSGSSGATGSTSNYAETSTTSAGRVSSVAGLAFDGQPRTLIYPDNPRITLPPELAKKIDSNRTVTIKFTVRKDGSVPGTLVTFTPLASLPAEIRDYLRAEFAQWRFEAGDQDGQASFSYSIKLE